MSKEAAYLEGFLEKISETRLMEGVSNLTRGAARLFEDPLHSTDAFGNAPELLPSTNLHTYMRTMHEIYSDPTLRPWERNQLKAKLEARPKTSEPGESTAGKLLGAGMGATAASLLGRYLLATDSAKAQLSPFIRKLLALGAIGAGGYLGLQQGGRAFSLEPRIIDPRRPPQDEEYSPWKISLV